jgi:hypothetical protein
MPNLFEAKDNSNATQTGWYEETRRQTAGKFHSCCQHWDIAFNRLAFRTTAQL